MKVMVLSAGDPAGINFCRSLKLCGEKYLIQGVDTNAYRLAVATADERYLLPPSDRDEYWQALCKLVQSADPDFLYAADTNKELELVSDRRDELKVRTFLPGREAVAIYENKWLSYNYFKKAGLKVPETVLVRSRSDIEAAIGRFGAIWLRAIRGSGGRGSLPTKDPLLASAWVERYSGWGEFTAAEVLTKRMATWIGLWANGDLIACQGRERLHWEYSHLAPSGVTGITGAQVTTNDQELHEVALAAIRAVPIPPHAIVSVDVTYDNVGAPNPTEIQASRFYSSIFFLATAGLNLPDIYVDLAVNGRVPALATREHPIPNGLVWLKAVDCLPQLIEDAELVRLTTEWSKLPGSRS